MDGESLLTWNATNWVTVVLMTLTGFFAFGLLQKWYQKRQASA